MHYRLDPSGERCVLHVHEKRRLRLEGGRVRFGGRKSNEGVRLWEPRLRGVNESPTRDCA